MSGSTAAAHAYNESLLPTKNIKANVSNNVNSIKKGMNAAFARLTALANSIKSTPKAEAHTGGKRKTRTKHHTKKHGRHHAKRHTKHHGRRHAKRLTRSRRNNH